MKRPLEPVASVIHVARASRSYADCGRGSRARAPETQRLDDIICQGEAGSQSKLLSTDALCVYL